MIARFAKSLQSLQSVVAFTHITGTITKETTQKLDKDLTSLKWKAPKMIAVSINSSHGSLAQAELIVQKLKSASTKFDCPIYTFAEDLALGPAYYILSSGNKVFADVHSLIGNIAVSSKQIGLTEFSKQFQINYQNITSGKNKVRLNPFEKVKPEDEVWLKGILEQKLGLFKSYVLDARGNKISGNLDIEKKIFSGDSFIAKKAIELGLVDQLGEVYSVVENEYPGVKVVDFPQKDVGKWLQHEISMTKIKHGDIISQEELYEALDMMSVNMLSNRMHSLALS